MVVVVVVHSSSNYLFAASSCYRSVKFHRPNFMGFYRT